MDRKIDGILKSTSQQLKANMSVTHQAYCLDTEQYVQASTFPLLC